MKDTHKLVVGLSDGFRTSSEIARMTGLNPRHVRKIWQKYNAPRPSQGAQRGSKNHRYKCGRTIDHDGYALVLAPSDHPYKRSTGYIYEHRLVMEKKIGRHLSPQEVVDHIDGLTLHNHPSNLRLFENNGAHLRETISGRKRNWSEAGRKNIGVRSDLGKEYQPVDTYSAKRKQGDARLLQILRAAYVFGINSPYLLGTHHHLKQARIDASSRCKIKHALAALSRKWEEPLFPL